MTVTNPWLAIPLSDYESHMALPDVAQAQLLAGLFDALLRDHRPASLAVIGCAGGNGFDRINTAITRRVVGVDINPEYLDAVRQRYGSRVPNLELIAGDIQSGSVRVAPVELVYAALVLEYVELQRALECLRPLVADSGVLATVVQLPGSSAVSPTPFSSVEALSPWMRQVDPDQLERSARAAGFRAILRRRVRSPGGKDFMLQVFRTSVQVEPAMHIRPAVDADADDLVELWLSSVRASHEFLSEEEIQALLPGVQTYLAAATPALVVLCTGTGDSMGFMGMTESNVDSLFLAPKFFGLGGGRRLLDHARSMHAELTVQVSEQNHGAVGFYRRYGFVVERRTDVDDRGRPYPVLHMRLSRRR